MLYIGNGWGERDNEWIGGMSDIGLWNVCLTGGVLNTEDNIPIAGTSGGEILAMYNAPTSGIAALQQYGVSPMDKLFTLYDTKPALPTTVTTGNGTLTWKYVSGLTGASGGVGHLTGNGYYMQFDMPAGASKRSCRATPIWTAKSTSTTSPLSWPTTARPVRCGPWRVHRRRQGGHQRPDDRAGELQPERGLLRRQPRRRSGARLGGTAGGGRRQPVGLRLVEVEIEMRRTTVLLLSAGFLVGLATEVRADGLIANWKLNEPAGSTSFADSSGNGNTGTLYGTDTLTTIAGPYGAFRTHGP